MTAPTSEVRGATYLRDGFRCVSCGRSNGLQWQHRQASGLGGRGRKAPALTTADGVTSCYICNPRYESDMQQMALALGWKLLRNLGCIKPIEVPFYVKWERQWYLPGEGTDRTPIHPVLAAELIAATGVMAVA